MIPWLLCVVLAFFLLRALHALGGRVVEIERLKRDLAAKDAMMRQFGVESRTRNGSTQGIADAVREAINETRPVGALIEVRLRALTSDGEFQDDEKTFTVP